MSILSFIPIIEILIFIVVLSCILLLVKLILNRRKMDKLDAELSRIRNVNNIINDEKYLEMTLPFSPFI